MQKGNVYPFANTLIARLSSCLIGLLIMIHFAGAAHAIMASSVDAFSPASTEVILKLQTIKQTKDFFKSAMPEVFIFKAKWDSSATYLFFRFETTECKEWCPTAIFKTQISKASFRAFAILPRKLTRGDVGFYLCGACKFTWPAIFSDDNGKSKAVYFTEQGIVF